MVQPYTQGGIRILQQSAAERFTKAEHALYYPYVGVIGTAGFVPTGYATIPGRYGAIGMNVTIPIFSSGLFKARQTQAELKAKAATENANDLQNRVIRDLRVAWLNATTAFDRMGLTRQLLEQAKISLDLGQTRYDLGLGNIVELSTAQLNVTSAQIADASALYEFQTQRIFVDYQTESYTNDVVQGALSPHTGTPVQDSLSMGLRSRAAWDVMLGLCACTYLGLVLFDDVESPLLSLALIALVAREIIQPHVRNR